MFSQPNMLHLFTVFHVDLTAPLNTPESLLMFTFFIPQWISLDCSNGKIIWIRSTPIWRNLLIWMEKKLSRLVCHFM